MADENVDEKFDPTGVINVAKGLTGDTVVAEALVSQVKKDVQPPAIHFKGDKVTTATAGNVNSNKEDLPDTSSLKKAPLPIGVTGE